MRDICGDGNVGGREIGSKSYQCAKCAYMKLKKAITTSLKFEGHQGRRRSRPESGYLVMSVLT